METATMLIGSFVLGLLISLCLIFVVSEIFKSLISFFKENKDFIKGKEAEFYAGYLFSFFITMLLFFTVSNITKTNFEPSNFLSAIGSIVLVLFVNYIVTIFISYLVFSIFYFIERLDNFRITK